MSDVWEAITDPDRVRRWFLPLTGDLRPGGTFQLEGHAGGEIISCEPPAHLVVTFGGENSLVDVRLSADGEQTLLILEHAVPLSLAGSAAGALYVGPGWDGALMSIGLYLDGKVADNPVAAANTPEAQQFSAESIDAWTAAVEASGTADAGPSPPLGRRHWASSLPTWSAEPAYSRAASRRPSGSRRRSSRSQMSPNRASWVGVRGSMTSSRTAAT